MELRISVSAAKKKTLREKAQAYKKSQRSQYFAQEYLGATKGT